MIKEYEKLINIEVILKSLKNFND